jgi:nucleolar MIF4G domain-containing protein 1
MNINNILGRWWLVGASWSNSASKESNNNLTSSSNTQKKEDKILQLARQQRMNTDIRRSIFCVIMGAEVILFNCAFIE